MVYNERRYITFMNDFLGTMTVPSGIFRSEINEALTVGFGIGSLIGSCSFVLVKISSGFEIIDELLDGDDVISTFVATSNGLNFGKRGLFERLFMGYLILIKACAGSWKEVEFSSHFSHKS